MRKKTVHYKCDYCDREMLSENQEEYPHNNGWLKIDNLELNFNIDDSVANKVLKDLDFCSNQCYLNYNISMLGINTNFIKIESNPINRVSNPNIKNKKDEVNNLKKQVLEEPLYFNDGFNDSFNQSNEPRPQIQPQPKEYQEPKKKGFFGRFKK